MNRILSRLRLALLSAAAVAISGCGSGGDPSDFLLTVDSQSIQVMADYTTPAITLHVKAVDAFHATVVFTAVVPAGITCKPACTATTTSDFAGTSSVVFHFDTAANLEGNTVYPIVFHGVERKTNGDLVEHDATVSVAVTSFNGVPPPPDFDFNVSPAFEYASVPPRGSFKDSLHYTLTFTRYNHYTGPISVVATPQDPETYCSTPTCSLVDTLDVTTTPFTISTDSTDGRHVTLFTASVAPYVTKTASATILVTGPPVTMGPGPQ